MEEVHELLVIAKKYSSLLGRYQWKISKYLCQESFNEENCFDISRQFYEISENYLTVLLDERRKFNLDEISSMLKFTNFAKNHRQKEYKVFAEINFELFSLLTNLNNSKLQFFGIDVYFNNFNNIVSKIKNKKHDCWSKLLKTISKGFKELKNRQYIPQDLAIEFLNTISKNSDLFDLNQLSEFLKSIESNEITKQIAYLDIIEKVNRKNGTNINKEIEKSQTTIEQIHIKLKALFNTMLFDNYEEAKELILKNKNIIILSLTNKIVDDYNKLVEPNRKVKNDKFFEARKLILSVDENDRQKAYELFRTISRKNERNNVAKEWLHFAEYKINPLSGTKNWENEVENNIASWEVRWNLAGVYLNIKQPYKALQTLKNITNAPFLHLKFGLYVALEIYKSLGSNLNDNNEAIIFLKDHLVKLPLAECFLVHLILNLEKNKSMNLFEYAYLEKYTKICTKNIQLLDTKKEHDYDDIITFQQELLDLTLEDTWLIWIKDYTDNHYYNSKAWKMLSEVYIRKNDKLNAENALKHIIIANISKYEKQGKNIKSESAKYLRWSLIELFDFYIKQALSENAKTSIKDYKNELPEFWDFKVSDNNRLISLTKKYLSIENVKDTIIKGDLVLLWNNLNEPISKIQNLNDLKSLNSRINEALNLFKLDDSDTNEKKEYFRQILQDLISLEQEKSTSDEFISQLNNLNYKLKTTDDIVKSNPVFSKLKSLSSAFHRVYKFLNESLKTFNKPIVSPDIIGEGLSVDISETSVLVSLSNNGIGDIENLKLSCLSIDSSIRSNGNYVIKKLSQNSLTTIAIPVIIDKNKEKRIDKCTLHLIFSWGILKELSEKQGINIKWFSFNEYISKFEKNKHELIKPFIDGPINFLEHDSSLFQGREDEIKIVRSRFLDSKDFQPIYFHGTRKVGKTSLLRKIEMELMGMNFTSLHIELSRLPVEKQNIENIVFKLLELFSKEAMKLKFDKMILEIDEYKKEEPLTAFENFIDNLFKFNGERMLVLMIDEFQLMVNSNTVELLDLFRRLNNKGQVSFIFSGLVRPEIIRKLCINSQLSFAPIAIDFLKEKAIEKLLTEPVSKVGIEFHQSAKKAILLLTEGNPFHISQIAQKCIDILNFEHRNLVVESDVYKVAEKLIKDDYVFSISTLTPLVLEIHERENIIKLAKAIKNNDHGITLLKAKEIIKSEMLSNLQHKFLIETSSGNIRIRGNMIWMYLNDTVISEEEIKLPKLDNSLKSLGIFIDYENVQFGASNEGQQQFIKKLLDYYSTIGRIVCKWVAAFSFKNSTKIDLQKEGFGIKEDSNIDKWKKRDKDTADFILIEIITEEYSQTQPEIYVIVAGDVDYIEKIKLLNKNGKFVRLVGYKNKKHISTKYFDYYNERRSFILADGRTEDQVDFVIDDLDEILK